MKKITDMTDKELQETVDKEEAIRQSIFKTIIKPAERKLKRAYNIREKAKAEIVKRKLAKIKKSKRIDWDYLLEGGHHVSAEQYKAVNDFVLGLGLYNSGFQPETNQTCITLTFRPNTQTDEEVKTKLTGLRKVLPHLKPLKNGYIYIDILDKDCSLHGSYHLLINEDKNEYLIKRMYYHREEDVKACKTLKEAVEYIQKELS